MSTPSPESDSPAVEKLKSLLRHTMRITVQDGRIFLGTFAGTDRLLNVLLINTDEFKLSPPHVNLHGRFVGLILVPWRLVVKIEVHAPVHHRSSAQAQAQVDPDPGVGLRGIVDRIGDETAYTGAGAGAQADSFT